MAMSNEPFAVRLRWPALQQWHGIAQLPGIGGGGGRTERVESDCLMAAINSHGQRIEILERQKK
jgi:hypothetical protein